MSHNNMAITDYTVDVAALLIHYIVIYIDLSDYMININIERL